MKHRPLVVICLCLMAVIGMVRMLYGEEAFSRPADPGLEAAVEAHDFGTLYGQIYRRQHAADQCIYYLKNSLLVMGSHQYSLQNTKVTTAYDEIYSPGDSLQVKGYLRLPGEATNPGQFDARSYYARKGIALVVQAETIRVTRHQPDLIREGITRLREALGQVLEARLSPEDAGVLKGMLLGDASEMEPELNALYRLGGISHILAISGLHISLLGMGLLRLLTPRVGIKPASVISGLFLLGYLILTGFPVSAQRGVIMFWVRLLARLSGRRFDRPSALALAAIIVLMENPGYLFDSGFLLSFGAALGIGLLNRKKLSGPAFGLVLWLLMLPVTLYYFYEASLSAALINLLVLPMMSALLLLGLAGALAGLALPFVCPVVFAPVRIILWAMRGLCTLGVSRRELLLTPGRPGMGRIIFFELCLVAALFLWEKGRIVRVLTISLTAAAFLWLVSPPAALNQVTTLDVGQGDAHVITCDNGDVYLVDGGSSSKGDVGRYIILPCLKAKGVRKLKAIILTHPDEDHMNGILSLLAMMGEGECILRAETLYLPQWMKGTAEEFSLKAAAAQAGVQVAYLHRGMTLTSGTATLKILHPDGGDYREDTNGGSTTFLLTMAGLRMLFTGDLEGEAEGTLARSLPRADILKVAHHGSKNATAEALLEVCRPRLAIISVGRNNRYHHPADEVLERLSKAGAAILRTDEGGAVSIIPDQGGVVIRRGCR